MWFARLVGRVVASPAEVQAKVGMLTKQEAKAMFLGTEYKDFFKKALELLAKFDIVIEVKNHPEFCAVIPTMLPSEPPRKELWSAADFDISQPTTTNAAATNVPLSHVPFGFFPQLQAHLARLMTPLVDLLWRDGAVFKMVQDQEGTTVAGHCLVWMPPSPSATVQVSCSGVLLSRAVFVPSC